MVSQSPEKLLQNLLDLMQQKRAIQDQDVLDAFSKVPRHLFLPDFPLEQVYSDTAIAIKTDAGGTVTSSSSQPTMMAIMLEQLQLRPGQNALEIGAATGYNAAIIQKLVGDGGRVTSIEIDHELVKQARHNLQNSGFGNVLVVHGNGIQGYAPRAAYDRIISTAVAWDISPHWLQQLKPDGRLVTPIWLDGIQVSAAFTMQPDGTLYSEDNRPCGFVLLRDEIPSPSLYKQIGSSSLVLLADEIEKVDTAALHMLLSDDYEYNNFSKPIIGADHWMGFQIYLMLHEPQKAVFSVYRIADEQKAYGMQGSGVALFTPASAAFAGYSEQGRIYTFAGSDACLLMQEIFDQWEAEGRPDATWLRLRVIPAAGGEPSIDQGKLYKRQHAYLHAWIEPPS